MCRFEIWLLQPYINLIKKIKNKKHNELTILNEIFYTINDFAELSTANQLSRGLIYLSAFQRKEDISIKTVFEKRKKNFTPYINEVPKGYLSKYQRNVSQANFGAIAQ